MTSARPPNAAAGKPPPITLPKVIRSGRQPSSGAVEPPLALPGDPEAGHHLVADEQRAVLPAGLGEEAVEPRLGRDHAHVAGRRLGDQAGDPVAVLGERLLHRGPVVVGQHQGERGRGLRDAGGAGQREGGQPRAGGGEQRVDVAVVAAGELHHHVAAGEAAGQPDRGHGRLGARGDEPDLLDRRPRHDLLGQLDLGPGRRAVRRPAGHRRLRRPPRPRGGRGRAASAPTSRPGRRTRCRPRRSARRPCAEAMNRGVPPTALKARTGEFTPPGVTASARSNERGGLGRLRVGTPHCLRAPPTVRTRAPRPTRRTGLDPVRNVAVWRHVEGETRSSP